MNFSSSWAIFISVHFLTAPESIFCPVTKIELNFILQLKINLSLNICFTILFRFSYVIWYKSQRWHIWISVISYQWSPSNLTVTWNFILYLTFITSLDDFSLRGKRLIYQNVSHKFSCDFSRPLLRFMDSEGREQMDIGYHLI